MKKIPNWIWVALFFAVLITVKFLFLGKNEDGLQAQGKGKASPPVSVNYYVAGSDTLQTNVFTTGKIGTLNEVELKPEANGRLIALYFTDGQQVNKGKLIARLNDAELQAQLAKNKIQVKLAEEKLERLRKLLAINGVSKEEFDVQDNEVASLKADAQWINAQLMRTVITAPFSGIIGLRNVSEGAIVTQGESIATLVQTRPLFVEFALPERYSTQLKKGMQVRFGDKDAGTNTYSATVYAIEPRIDETTRTLRARAMYSGNADLYPGSFVKVFADLGSAGKSILIPTQCIIPILKGQKVYVYRKGQLNEIKVITGIRTDEKIQVLEGLQEGDTVLTTGLMSVKKDSKLKLIKQDR